MIHPQLYFIKEDIVFIWRLNEEMQLKAKAEVKLQIGLFWLHKYINVYIKEM